MRFHILAAAALLGVGQAALITGFPGDKPAPKVFIISMFEPEADVWYENLPGTGYGDLLAKNVSVVDTSMLYPNVHCVHDYTICQVTTGEAEINAASTISGVVLSGMFDLTKTYFLIAGIAGANPARATLGSAALGRFAVQVALQYEIDAREMPANFSTGYFGFGTYAPNVYPAQQYGTEVFELNEALRGMAFQFGSKANMSTDPTASAYGARYAASAENYTMATLPPSVVKCDVATSDVYYSGLLLSEAFDNTTTIWTNGTGAYCMTAQEDNATLEVMVRAAIHGLVDFGRIMLMRTGSDFDRPPPGVSDYDHLLIMNQNGFNIAIDNIFNVGIEIVRGILESWECTFRAGVKPTNYIGDILGSLGGTPDFGPGSVFGGEPAPMKRAEESLPVNRYTLKMKRSYGQLKA